MFLDTAASREYVETLEGFGYAYEGTSFYAYQAVEETNTALANSGIPLIVKLVYFGEVAVCCASIVRFTDDWHVPRNVGDQGGERVSHVCRCVRCALCIAC